jgi:shikimate kinase/3-dehydroquinate synthase
LMVASERNIVLTGFMAVGKSTVGRQVAQRLGRAFVDMDTLIEERAGKSIPQIFEQLGESTFRQYEREVAEELGGQRWLVIATGGGALVDARNRQALARNGYLICLSATPQALLERLQGCQDRPMLWADDREARLRELCQARQPAYAEIPYHIDTTRRAPAEVVERVLALAQAAPTCWDVATPTGKYPVLLLPGGLAYLGDALRARGIASQVAVVSDERVWPLYGQQVLDSLEASDHQVAVITLPAGEQFKTLDTVRLIYDRLIAGRVDRSSAVVAVGGGVITDMAGFAAATFLRGVPFVPVPTTLLGMVDASVGGKVAVDHPQGKNLIGAFVQPLFVLVDTRTLETLPAAEYRSGLAEIIKAGVIADPELFAAFESAGGDGRELRWMVERALAVKIDVVQQDPYERGRRAVLNLGHTFAHAFEVLSDYQLAHGLAVSIGMAAAAHLAELRGVCSDETRVRIVSALERADLPTRYDAHAPAEVYAAMAMDKKRLNSRLRFVLPRAIGQVEVDGDVPAEQVLAALERSRA